MRLTFTLIFLFSLLLNASGAGLSSVKSNRLSRVQVALGSVQQYLGSKAESYTLKGMEAYTGRKLSSMERRLFKLYKNGEDEDAAAMNKNKRLGTLAMILGIAGLSLLFIPYVAVVSFFLLPAALILGIMAVSRAKNYDNKSGSGFGSGLTGIILGGLGVVLIIAVIIAFASGAWL